MLLSSSVDFSMGLAILRPELWAWRGMLALL
jgi:hypothetical protein